MNVGRGRLTLFPHIPPSSLDNLNEFSHVWLLFVFHANNPAALAGAIAPLNENDPFDEDAKSNDSASNPVRLSDMNPQFHSKVRVPRLNGAKKGCLATRSPYRINPIGLSVAKLDKIIGTTLYLSGIDLINGTPV